MKLEQLDKEIVSLLRAIYINYNARERGGGKRSRLCISYVENRI